ncbi:MAG: peptide ABC transporter substrate-binding protein [Anaerovoracaceae bacterium]|jgi:oligopeptide transport system substrate-binding protein
MCGKCGKVDRTKKYVIFLLILLLGLSVMGCGRDAKEEGQEMNLTICLSSEPGSLDPVKSIFVDEAIMLNHLFEGLTKWTDDGQGASVLVGGMAESWQVGEGGKEYVFHLRKDAKWSDGRPVTASDFVYGWKRLADSSVGSEHTYMFDMIQGWGQARKGEIKFSKTGVKAVDDHTLRVSLTYDCPFFLELCATPPAFPVRKDIIDKYGDQWSFKAESYICNGSYTLKSWVHNAYIQTKANDYYYDREHLGPDGIKFILMDDDDAKLMAFDKKEIDFILNPPAGKGKALNEGKNDEGLENLGTQFLYFNTQKAPFNDPRVREAFSLAIDRGQVLKEGGKGAVAADAYVPTGMPDLTEDSDFRRTGGSFYATDLRKYLEDCNRARELLAAAGYPEGLDFMPIEYICDRSEGHENIGKALRDMWGRELGISVSISSMERNRFHQARKSGDYEIAYGEYLAGYKDPLPLMEPWLSHVSRNNSGYSNVRYDELIEQVRTTDDPAMRIPLLHEAEEILISKDHVLAPLLFYSPTYMKASSLKGVYNNIAGYFFFDRAVK